MTDPVVGTDGHTYELSSIEGWFRRGNTTSPLTGRPMSLASITVNRALRNTIEEYQNYLRQNGNLSVLNQESPDDTKYLAVCTALHVSDLSPEQKEIVDNILTNHAILETNSVPAAVACCSFIGNPRLRSCVYQEFSQWLHPQIEFANLGQLEAHVKKDVIQATLNALVNNPNLSSPVEIFRAALGELSRLYTRGPHFNDFSITQQQNARHQQYLQNMRGQR